MMWGPLKKKIIAGVLIASIAIVAFLGGVFFSAPDRDYDGDYDDDYAYYDDFGYDDDSYDDDNAYWNEGKVVFDPEQIINDIPAYREAVDKGILTPSMIRKSTCFVIS